MYMPKDYYKILGIDRAASQDEVKSAFRRLAHKHHPDKAGGDESKFKEINEAYSILSDPEKRRRYDTFGSAGDGPHGNGFGFGNFQEGNASFGDFGDIFNDFFGFGQQHDRRSAGRGKDVVVDVEVSLEEAFGGINKQLVLTKHVSCDRCAGKGAEPGTAFTTCAACQGRGGLERVEQTFFGTFTRLTTCPTCRGRGEIPEKPCATCRGDGRVRRSMKMDVAIPAGVDDGETLKVESAGETGKYGASAGDLFLNIHVKPHAVFHRKGNDIWTKADISFSNAILGTKIDVPTLDGSVRLTIPPGTPAGKIFRLQGKGMPASLGRSRAAARGDEYVTVGIKVPTKISKRAQKLLEELEGEL